MMGFGDLIFFVLGATKLAIGFMKLPLPVVLDKVMTFFQLLLLLQGNLAKIVEVIDLADQDLT